MSLPECHSRRELPGEAGVFFCAHPRVHIRGQRVTPANCRQCDRWRQLPPPVFRSVTPPDFATPARGPCAFLGDVVGLRTCSSCRGLVQVKVFACRHPGHGETTVAACASCGDHAPRPAAGAGVTGAAEGVTR